jgi:3-methyl-2-oxobutanoate hydroxymethyltransferase
MLMLTHAVTRAVERAVVVAVLPFGSYQAGEVDALRRAIRLVKE